MIFRICMLLALLFVAGCAPMQMKGVNLLQSRNVALDDLRNVENMQHLKSLGANTVALVPFINQSAANACDLKVDRDYSDDRLKRSIRNARSAGLRVVLKPQILIPGSWAGEVGQDTEAGWKCWFAAYGRILLDYARIAEDTRVETLVVGTELVKTESRPEWKSLLIELREKYSGNLSYVGHGIGGVMRFSALEQLDSVAISFYPALEDAPEFQDEGARQRMLAWMQEIAESLKSAVNQIGKPFWFAEVGITSRAGALKNPWQWVDSLTSSSIPDAALQAEVLDGWLKALSGKWHQGILIWNWYSDPKAGGAGDLDFTIQNKPALSNVSCHWLGSCK